MQFLLYLEWKTAFHCFKTDDLLSNGFCCMKGWCVQMQGTQSYASAHLCSQTLSADLVRSLLLSRSRLLMCWDWSECFTPDCGSSVELSQNFPLQKSRLLQCCASCPFKTIIAWHLCPSDSLTNMWPGTLPSWQMGVSTGSQETMYLHLVYLLRAGFPVGMFKRLSILSFHACG